MTVHRRSNPDASTPPTPRSAGVDGWYIFDGKNLRGPITDDELGDLHDDPVQRRRFQVSREGFQRWYALEEIGRILSLSRRPVQDSLQREISEFNRQYETKLSQLETMEKSFALESKLSPPAEDEELGKFKIYDFEADLQEDAEFASQPAPQPAPKVQTRQPTPAAPQFPSGNIETMLAEATMKGLQHDDERTASTTMSMDDDETGETAAASQPPVEDPVREPTKIPGFDNDYVVIKGRLRLGTARRPVVAALLPLLTLGISLWSWYRSAALECAYHLTSNYRRIVPPFICALVPLVHIFMFYRLAEAIAAMERQNNYCTTSPLLAAGLSCFPPAGIFYLQNKMNQHWQLHIRAAKSDG